TYYAHASSPNLYVHTLLLKEGDHALEPLVFKGLPSDVDFTTVSTGDPSVSCMSGPVSLPEKSPPNATSPPESFVSICHSVLPERVKVPPGGTFEATYAYAVSTSASPVPVSLCSSLLSSALSSPSALRSQHEDTWSALGKPSITTSNETLNELIKGTLTSLRSTMHPDHPYPPSPGGTSTNGYFGLFFWDSDLWIASSLLLLNPSLSLQSSLYRVSRISSSLSRASSLGHLGCMVPWQSGGSGHDLSLAPFANEPEQHVTSAAILLIENLESVGVDVPGAKELVLCAADFWSGRMDGEGGIEGVVGPDEFGTGGVGKREGGGVAYKGVKDNPYTNVGARRVLEYAYRLTGEPKYKEKAELVRVLYDEGGDYHPQYVDFPDHQIRTSGGDVKQADVTMMAWPWDYDYETDETLRNDLDYYSNRYASGGPGMTESITCVGNLRAGSFPLAREAFNRQLKFAQPQFGIWTETEDPAVHKSDMGCYNFMTGAGGFIQSIVHGYGGIRIARGRVEVTMKLDGEVFDGLALENFVFRGNTFTARGTESGGDLELELTSSTYIAIQCFNNRPLFVCPTFRCTLFNGC
ncbi:hypothetical protein TrRE_jg12293, partial [Triparma retinervis]